MGETYYIFVGCAAGQFEIEKGPDAGKKRAYANMYVLTPVSDFASDDYKGEGFKAEKLSCLSSEIWKDLSLGEKVKLYFDDKKRVVLATSLGMIISLES